MTYSFFYQMGHITSERNSLRHDDRCDAVTGAIRQIVQYIDYDQQRAEKERGDEYERKKMAMLSSPDGFQHYMMYGAESVDGYVAKNSSHNALEKYWR